MYLSRKFNIKLCQSYTKTHIYVIWPTAPRDQILKGHWLKLWSCDTDIKLYYHLYLLTMNKNYANNNRSVPKFFRHLWPLDYPNFKICTVFAEYDLFRTFVYKTFIYYITNIYSIYIYS